MNPDQILRFCFPDGLDKDLERHMEFWKWLMRGGSDAEIVERFAQLPDRALEGDFDDWPATATGRLALILVLDQFPRSIFRGNARAYHYDVLALKLCEEGLANDQFDQLTTPWERTMFAMPLVHAEGPFLRARAQTNVTLAEATLVLAPNQLKPAYEFCLEQSRRHQNVIVQFGRHPHRNGLLDRDSTPDEERYLLRGKFPHEHEIEV